jgi:hypothetical protein
MLSIAYMYIHISFIFYHSVRSQIVYYIVFVVCVCDKKNMHIMRGCSVVVFISFYVHVPIICSGAKIR